MDLTLNAYELIIRCSEQWQVRDFRSILIEHGRRQPILQVRNMVRTWKYVVRRKPCWPKRTSGPTVSLKSFGCKLPRDIKIDYTKSAAGLKDSDGVINGRKPIGNHG